MLHNSNNHSTALQIFEYSQESSLNTQQRNRKPKYIRYYSKFANLDQVKQTNDKQQASPPRPAPELPATSANLRVAIPYRIGELIRSILSAQNAVENRRRWLSGPTSVFKIP